MPTEPDNQAEYPTQEAGAERGAARHATDRRRVTFTADGPALIEGPVELVTPDGRTLRCDRFQVAICLCRRSKNYPLCDTSHRRRAPRR